MAVNFVAPKFEKGNIVHAEFAGHQYDGVIDQVHTDYTDAHEHAYAIVVNENGKVITLNGIPEEYIKLI